MPQNEFCIIWVLWYLPDGSSRDVLSLNPPSDIVLNEVSLILVWGWDWDSHRIYSLVQVYAGINSNQHHLRRSRMLIIDAQLLRNYLHFSPSYLEILIKASALQPVFRILSTTSSLLFRTEASYFPSSMTHFNIRETFHFSLS